MRDPYYQKILAGLERLDNPTAFEECASDLLKDAYPSLAWIRGGADAGMDGAIADGEGEAYPVIVTTAKDVARNLRKNLESYTRSGKERRMAVLATSRRVTPPKVEELKAIARNEYGFTLVVHEQYDIASRLYRNSRWVRDLLGITGEPPALSAVPRTCRPLVDIELVGRDADLRWLHETEGHRLVVGQPGSGKTALLLQLVREGKALFLASDEEARIAEAYRDSQPYLILVDDAHVDMERLTRLRQIRADIGAKFEIVASTWPGAEDDVAHALGGTGSGNIRLLEGLTRAEILQVLRGIGISESDDDPYLSLLVDQSANKPGLAVTLGSLWLRGEGHDLLTGKALKRSLIPALKQVLEHDHDPTQMLACFALGGDDGMSMEAIGEFLGKGLGEIHRSALQASQGGVLSKHRDHLSVQPEALRSVLLAEVFFSPSAALPYRPLLDRAPSLASAIGTLAIAARRRANVPREELRDLLLEGGTRQAWQAFALLGEDEGSWVLETYPENIAAVTPELLRSVPRPTIQRLLHEAERAESRPLHWGPPHPLHLLRNWVQDIPDPQYGHQVDEALRRRRMQVEEAKRYLRRGGDLTVALRACFLALSPRLESSRLTAAGDAVTLRQGSLPISSVPRVLELWADVREDLGELTPESWLELMETLRGWEWPRFGREPTEEEADSYRTVARRIVSDLADFAQGRPGLLQALKEWANRIALPLALPENDFAVLFPLSDHSTAENWKEEAQAAKELAARWASRPRREAVRQLASYAAEAQSFGYRDSLASREFFYSLTDAVEAPERWLAAFLEEGLPANWLSPLLERVVQQRPMGWEQSLVFCLESDDYSWVAADLAIRTKGIPQETFESALARLPADSVETACFRRRVPLETLTLLLGHGREEIAVAAAVGEWFSEPRGEVRPQIGAEWRAAVLRLGSAGGVELRPPGQKFGFESILGSEPDLAAAWLLARLEDVVGPEEPVKTDGVYAAAIRALTSDRREELLRQLPASGPGPKLIPLLVGESTQLYCCLLDQTRLRQFHLAPLAGRPPDEAWKELAKLAIAAGHEPRAIAEITFKETGARRGFGIEYWGRWEVAFRNLLESAPDLQEVARYGIEKAESEIARAQEWQRQFELTGKFF